MGKKPAAVVILTPIRRRAVTGTAVRAIFSAATSVVESAGKFKVPAVCLVPSSVTAMASVPAVTAPETEAARPTTAPSQQTAYSGLPDGSEAIRATSVCEAATLIWPKGRAMTCPREMSGVNSMTAHPSREAVPGQRPGPNPSPCRALRDVVGDRRPEPAAGGAGRGVAAEAEAQVGGD